MLELTESARQMVRDLVALQDAPEGSGLRIAATEEDGEAALSLELASGPEEGDQVVEGDGTRVFLEQEAATLLDDKVLDAERHEDHYHFSVSEQGSAGAA